jgi:diacylglycerol diphosphate phosphatase/phosphatidate phosphatase
LLTPTAFIAYRTYYPGLKHAQCHLPLLPRPSAGELPDGEYEADRVASPEAGVRLLHEGIPRQSEEEVAWRRPSDPTQA